MSCKRKLQDLETGWESASDHQDEFKPNISSPNPPGTKVGESVNVVANFFTPQNSKFPWGKVYKPLAPFTEGQDGTNHDFRVMRILPGSKNGTMECELLPSKLCSETIYEALSYCAGDPTDYKTIMLNGHPFNVFRSAYEALWKLCSTSGLCIFWVDQICINQTNIEERDSQVLLMKMIYQNANRTYIWLGEEQAQPSTQSAFGLIHQFLHSHRTALRNHILKSGVVRQVSRGTGNILTDTLQLPDTVDPLRRYLQAEHIWYCYYNDKDYYVIRERAKEFQNDQVLQRAQSWLNTAARDTRNADSWLALFDLFRRGWWRRCWTVQEAVVSDELHLVCGQNFLPWEDMSLFLNIWSLSLSLPITYDATTTIDQDLESSIFWCTDIHYRINVLRRLPSSPNLRGCMTLHHETQASDARDKLFAMLGLLSDSGRKYGITPSYVPSNTTENVYLAAAEAILTVDNDVDMLYDAGGHGKGVTLPSWVPNWSRTKKTLIGSHQIRFQAGTSRPASLEISNDGRKLKLRGWIIGIIQDIGPTYAGRDFAKILSDWLRIYEGQPQEGVEPPDIDPFHRTLGLDCWQMAAPEPLNGVEERPRVWNASMAELGRVKDDITEHGIPKYSRFFMSKSGSPGMATDNAEAGHTIFIPSGARMPIIIQKTDGLEEYRLIGPCYLRDMMLHEVLLEEYQGRVHEEYIYLV